MSDLEAIYTDRIEVRCDPSLKAAAQRFAKQNHTKTAQVVRTALREYLAKHMESERAA